MAESWAAVAAAAVGVVIGLRHSFEPDHLMAVAALVAPQRGAMTAFRYGASWGVGHTVTLFVVGLVLALARASMPHAAGLALEVIVAAMIVLLGIAAVRGGVAAGRAGSHPVSVTDHARGTVRPHFHLGGFALARQPLMVGMVHGLSGSGALTALAVSALPTLPSQFTFMLLFGVGSTAGMSLAAGVAGWSLAHVTHRPKIAAALSIVTGVTAIVFGVVYGRPLVAELLLR